MNGNKRAIEVTLNAMLLNEFLKEHHTVQSSHTLIIALGHSRGLGHTA